MAEYASDSIPGLIRSLLDDTRDLIREEVALARSEIREEALEAKAVATAFGASALIGLIGATMSCFAIGGAVADLLGWPVWSGYGATALLLLAVTFVLVSYGRREVRKIRALPKTRAALKENVEWMQSKSRPR
jgi:hypothetical protein